MLKDEIKDLIKGDVEDSKAVIQKYSHDYSIFEVSPELVVFPKNVDDIKKLVKFVNEKRALGLINISLTARGAGTDMSGGPLNTSVILDMTRYMNGVLSVEEGNLGKQKFAIKNIFEISGLAKVLPGTYYRDFEKETLKKKV